MRKWQCLAFVVGARQNPPARKEGQTCCDLQYCAGLVDAVGMRYFDPFWEYRGGVMGGAEGKDVIEEAGNNLGRSEKQCGLHASTGDEMASKFVPKFGRLGGVTGIACGQPGRSDER